ncbi:MAG: cytochrome c maturation protein CcmE [bacterium]|nr:cytochrome c maturation protein CcmE [bacterium]
MINRRLVLPALALLAVLIGYLVWNNLSDNLVYYLTPSEAVDQRGDYPPGERFRLGGLVEAEGIAEADGGVGFVVGDGATSVAVHYVGTVPQLFREGIGVVVEGSWEGDRFHSDLLLIHHDEQYRAPDGEGAYEVPTGGT